MWGRRNLCVESEPTGLSDLGGGFGRYVTVDAMKLSEKDVIITAACFHITGWPRIVRLVASGA